MNRIINNETFNIDDLTNTSFPKNETIDEKLSYWLNSPDRNSHDIMEKIITIVEPNNYKNNIKIINDKSFELITNNNTIKFTLINGDKDEFPELIITKNGITLTYSVYYDYEENNVLIDSYSLNDINNNFVQYYNYNADCFEKRINTSTYSFYIVNPNYYDKKEKFLLNDKLKETIKNSNNDNIIDLFYILSNYLKDDDYSYSITKRINNYYDEEECIVVTDGKLSRLKLVKSTKEGIKITMEDDIKNNNSYFTINNKTYKIENEFNEFKTQKDELILSLKKKCN